MGDELWKWNKILGSGEGVVTGEGKIGEISPCFCPILVRDQPTLVQSHLFGHLPSTGDSMEAPRDFPRPSPPAPAFALTPSAGTALNSTPKSLLERATPISQLSQGMLLGFQGCDEPRSLIQAEAALPRVGHSLGGRLSTATVSLCLCH